MSERYTRVFELHKNLYAENSPVVISAGALLKDNQTGKILAQLKFRNITDKKIKALKISIISFDTVGKQLDDFTNYEYLDISAKRDEEFGQKVPIMLANNLTRSFSVSVSEVIFEDNSTWNSDEENWIPLKKAKKLSEMFQDSELVKQYKIEYGEKCEYKVTEDRDVWICSCGEVNKNTEQQCFKCGCNLQILKDNFKNLDVSELNRNKNQRIKQQKKEMLLNPMWLFIIVTLAIIPCFFVKTTIGNVFNFIGLGAGNFAGITGLTFKEYSTLVKFGTTLYFCCMVYFTYLVFRNRYDKNILIAVALLGVVNVIFSSSTAFAVVTAITVINIIYYLLLISFVAIGISPTAEKAKLMCKKLYFIPVVIKLLLYTFNVYYCYGRVLGYLHRNIEVRKILYVFKVCTTQNIYKIAFLIIIIDLIATFMFMRKLTHRSNCSRV